MTLQPSAVRGCKQDTPPRYAISRACWTMLPNDLNVPFMRTYQINQHRERDGRGSAEHRIAFADAVAYLSNQMATHHG
jgi:hypothetical protein